MKKKSKLASEIKKAKENLLKIDPKHFGTSKPLPDLKQSFVAGARGNASVVKKKKKK